MQLNEYTKLSERTDHTPESRAAGIKRLSDPDIFDLNHAMTGMLTEVGEFADVLKRHINYGKDIDWVNLAEESGDIFWYLAAAVRVIEKKTGVTAEQILQKNIDKLRTRFPNKFTTEQAINRDLNAERTVLES
jgi:NTP pyrophosphatase (non-canonical NTP hydrolase)